MYYSIEKKENEMWEATLKFIMFLAIFGFAAFVLPNLLVDLVNYLGRYVIGGLGE